MIHEAETLLREFVSYVRDQQHHEDILSLYLVVDPADERNQGPNPKWQIFLKNALTEIEAGLDPALTKKWKTVRLTNSSEETKWARIRLRLETYLTGYIPSGKTLVLFIGPNGELEYELPIRLENRAFYGWPHMTEFLWALDEYEQFLVVLFAQDQARALNLFLGSSADEVDVHVDQTWHRRLRKTGHQANIAQRQDELDRRFARWASERLNQHFLDSDDVSRVVFGGNLQVAAAVRNYLHPAVAERIISLMPIPIDAPAQEIADAMRDVALMHEREYEVVLVNQLVGRAKAGGRAALGMEAVDRALDMQSVSLLVLPYPIDPSIADELFVKGIYSGSDVEFVDGEAARILEQEGGIAARLYYVAQDRELRLAR
jgi:hypothetical protein